MKKVDKKILLLVLIFFSHISVLWVPVLGIKETKTFVAIADATIDQYNPNSNYGGDTSLEIGYFFEWLEACIKFDLTNKPSKIQKAELRLDFYHVEATTTVEIYKISTSWSEYSITWNNAPLYGSYLGEFTVYQEAIYIIDITNDIEYETGQWSICLTAEQENWLMVASKECYSWQEPPKIVFTCKASDLPIIIGVIVTIVIVAIVAIIAIGGYYYAKKIKLRKAALEPIVPQKKIPEQPVQEVREVIKAQTYCPMCGTPNPREAAYCIYCGEKFPELLD